MSFRIKERLEMRPAPSDLSDRSLRQTFLIWAPATRVAPPQSDRQPGPDFLRVKHQRRWGQSKPTALF